MSIDRVCRDCGEEFDARHGKCPVCFPDHDADEGPPCHDEPATPPRGEGGE